MKEYSRLPFSWKRIASLSEVLGPLIIALGYTGGEGQAYRLRNHFVSELDQVVPSDLALVFNACPGCDPFPPGLLSGD